ncbi:hypothetical protein L195_g056685 [Trifolium pratense]|uniref:Uncharacterized protein n=1 Tax=Trifolium pratense TaxID=57577 RepID=A0A2K3KSX8_TRIPR|nr:hypothetical protein L195_g056685 [Trifolium pratense]
MLKDRLLFDWEDEKLKELLELVQNVTLVPGQDDKWSFTIDKAAGFSRALLDRIATKDSLIAREELFPQCLDVNLSLDGVL